MSFFDIPLFDYDDEKRKFIENMNFLKNMSVEEATFYKKWEEMQAHRSLVSKASVVKARIWTPKDIRDLHQTIDEIEKMHPQIELVKSEQDEKEWMILRIFTHTMEFSQTPGRFLKFFVTNGEEENKKYLGCVSISSDVLSITDRDKYIGWNSQNRVEDNKKINNSAIGSCIMATQPFGYNFLGGKLAACLVTTSVVRDLWKKLYGDIMIGMTTTSLYGSYSMYNSLKWWHKCGESAGKVSIKPDDVMYEIWHRWVKENRRKEYEEMMLQKEGVSGPVTAAKQRTISLIFRELGIKSNDYQHGFNRGVYYALFYENGKEFLCDKIKEEELKLKPLFQEDKENIIKWWKPKAIERYKRLHHENKLKDDILFYKDIIGMSYKEAKEKYFDQVGR